MKSNKVTVEGVILNSMRRTVYTVVLALGILCLLFLYIGSLKSLKSSLTSEIETASQRVSLVVNGYKNIVRDLGATPTFSKKTIPIEYKERLLDRKCVEYNFSSGRIVNLDGFSDMDEFFRGDRRYFISASRGEVVISDPTLTKDYNDIAFFVASPVWREGIIGGEIDSVVYCTLEADFLNNLLSKFAISKHSQVYIIGHTGSTVASLDKNLVLNQNNNIKNAEISKKYKKIAKIEQEILDGNCNTKMHIFGLNLHCFAAAEIEGTPGWKIIIRAPVYDFLGIFYIFCLYIIVIAVVCWFYAVLKSSKISKMISVPVQKMAERLRMAAEGDYTSEVVDVFQLEEVKTISEAMQSLVNRMDSILNGSDMFKETVSIEKLIESKDFEPFLQYYRQKYGGLLSIKDSQGNLLSGEENSASSVLIRERISLNGRFVGFLEVTPTEKCSASIEALKSDLKIFANVVMSLAESNLRKLVQYKVWRENEEVNTKRFLDITEYLTMDIHKWMDDLERLQEQDEKKNFRQNVLKIMGKAKSALVTLDDSFERLRFMELKAMVKESDYAIVDLVERVKKKLELHYKAEDLSMIVFGVPQNLVGKLYGDFDAIANLILRFVSCFRNKNYSKKIAVYFDTVRKTYSKNLRVEFTLESGFLTDEEIKKVRTICKKMSENLENLKENPTVMNTSDAEVSSIENYISGFSQIYSVFKMAQLMNCEISLEESGEDVVILVEIAQLEGGS